MNELTDEQRKLIEKEYANRNYREHQLRVRQNKTEDEKEELTWINGYNWGMAFILNVLDEKITIEDLRNMIEVNANDRHQ